ncbi:transcriptional regulator MraZ [Spirochaetia bacterium]|nr:transcriptional regulator MraZ [Spirochaetia bacterium]
MLNGGANNTLDDKGRVTFPAALKKSFSGDVLILTRGIEGCLWAYSPEQWKIFSEYWERKSPMLKDVRRMQRHFLGWAQEVEIDKSGRLAIPQSLREYAKLTRNCTIMGTGQRIEIWDSASYEAYDEGEDDNALAAMAEQFGLDSE